MWRLVLAIVMLTWFAVLAIERWCASADLMARALVEAAGGARAMAVVAVGCALVCGQWLAIELTDVAMGEEG